MNKTSLEILGESLKLAVHQVIKLVNNLILRFYYTFNDMIFLQPVPSTPEFKNIPPDKEIGSNPNFTLDFVAGWKYKEVKLHYF